MSELFIVKVQIPLVTSDPTPQVLVYDRDRRLEQYLPMTQEVLDVMNGETKRYFWARLRGTELSLLNKVVGEQSW